MTPLFKFWIFNLEFGWIRAEGFQSVRCASIPVLLDQCTCKFLVGEYRIVIEGVLKKAYVFDYSGLTRGKKNQPNKRKTMKVAKSINNNFFHVVIFEAIHSSMIQIFCLCGQNI